MKITDVEALYLRLPEIQARTDSSQDALIVKVSTDAGMTGWHAGPIANAAAAEALTSILITINRRHDISHSGLKIVGQADH